VTALLVVDFAYLSGGSSGGLSAGLSDSSPTVIPETLQNDIMINEII
jgi:hypothetical protein